MADAVNYGRIALLPEGEYSETKQYEVGDVVSYSANGASYICHTKPPVGTLPTNENYFQLCGARGEKGEKGDTGDTGASGNTPYIGENGNWWIGATDTGVNASGGIEVDSALSETSENPVQNKVIDAAIKNLNQAIAQANQLITNLQALRASTTTYGMVKVTDSAAVTDSTGLALAATEKNALIPGTLGNKLAQLNTDLKPVPDVPLTILDSSNITNYLSGSIRYCVKNGVCYLSVDGLFLTVSGSFASIISGLPVPIGDFFVDQQCEQYGTITGTFCNRASEGAFIHYANANFGMWGSCAYPVSI